MFVYNKQTQSNARTNVCQALFKECQNSRQVSRRRQLDFHMRCVRKLTAHNKRQLQLDASCWKRARRDEDDEGDEDDDDDDGDDGDKDNEDNEDDI